MKIEVGFVSNRKFIRAFGSNRAVKCLPTDLIKWNRRQDYAERCSGLLLFIERFGTKLWAFILEKSRD